jgi:glycyl-tRNA synthetase
MDLAKRRGFLYPSFEIYGGLAGFYDYGPHGAAMKKRFEDLWRIIFLQRSAVPMAEVSTPRVTLHDVLKASGHVDEFTDLVVKCSKCGTPARADHLVEEAGYVGTADALSAEQIDEQIATLQPKCHSCGKKQWSNTTPLNLMNATEIGPGSGRIGFLRPETAQGIFTSFPNLQRHFRGKLPFGGAQIGGSNRNEISPRQGMLRLREFHMMEAEVFFTDTDAPFPAFEEIAERKAIFVPSSNEQPVERTFRDAVENGLIRNESLAYFMALTQEFLTTAGMDPARLRFRQHLDDEMAHYANDCWDAEFHSERYGWVECVGIADRGCFDLEAHAKASSKTEPFQVAVEFETPVTFTARKLVPNLGILGRTFKAEAKLVAVAMEAVFQDQIQTLADAKHAGFDPAWLEDELMIQGPKDAAPGTEPLSIGEWEIPADGYSVIDGEWTITGRKIIPRVIEPSFGVDRILYALWEHAYERGEKNGEQYTVMRLSPHVAPVQVAVFPLTGKGGLPDAAKIIEAGLRQSGIQTDYDESGNIGRRYARQDEIGTPVCITIDNETQVDGAVTIRDRDSMNQERVTIGELPMKIAQRFQL